MTEKDVKSFLKAKKEELSSRILVAISLLMILGVIVIEAIGSATDYTMALAVSSIVFLLASMGSSRWVTVPKSELVAIIQRQIGADPEALK